MRRCSSAGRCCRGARSAGFGGGLGHAVGSSPSAQVGDARDDVPPFATHPVGVGTEMPRPLSSQTSTQRHRQSLRDAVADRVQRADSGRVVERGVAEAADGDGVVRPGASAPSLRARPMAKATPTARGRWEAIVEVCGMTARRRRRTPCAGRRMPGRRWRRPCRAARRGAVVQRPSGLQRARPGRSRRSGSAAARGRWAAGRRRPGRWPRARPSRSCRSPDPAGAAAGPGCRSTGCRPWRRRGRAGRGRRGARPLREPPRAARTPVSRSSCGVPASLPVSRITARLCPAALGERRYIAVYISGLYS